MQIKIEEYRGFQIYFDTSDNRFLCEISDVYKKESTSFVAVKKYIDDFKAENNNFKPFKIVEIRGNDFSPVTIDVIGIRKDNRLIIKRLDGSVEQISSYHEDRFVIADTLDADILKELRELNYAEKESEKRFCNDRKAIMDRLNPISLKEYRKTHI